MSSAPDQTARIDDEASAWVSRMIANPKRHAAGLRDWVGTSQERADAYNRIYRNTAAAGTAARKLFGNQHVRQQSRRIESLRTIPYRRIVGLTAALMLMGAAVSAGVDILSRFFSPAGHIQQLPELATQVGEIRTITLTDGSRVTLDTQAALRVMFRPGERRIELEHGRARFEVAHDPARPFIVDANGVTVTARGTIFDVDVEKGVEVHLIRGAVDVTNEHRRYGQSPSIVHLIAGQKIAVPTDRPDDAPSVTEAKPTDAQWVGGTMTFDDVPAQQVVDEANRYARTRILFADASDGMKQVFLDVDIRNTRLVARNIASILHLTINETRPGTIILRKP